MYGRSLLAATVPASRTVVGVSGSRLLSRATKAGLQVHMHGTSDLADTATVAELNALFDTVLYFDQNPKSFRADREAGTEFHLRGTPVTARVDAAVAGDNQKPCNDKDTIAA